LICLFRRLVGGRFGKVQARELELDGPHLYAARAEKERRLISERPQVT